MLAKRVAAVPEGDAWIFEPKWDGFRAVVFRDGNDVEIQSRDGKSLNRYFPEVVATLLEQLPERCVLDGEIVIAAGGRLDFDLLSLRVHPAASRVKMLAAERPASVVFFDLLAVGDESLMGTPLRERKEKLKELLRDAKPPIHLTPETTDRTIAEDWFKRFEGAGLDGVMAKPSAGPYTPDKRTMLKVKHERDCDCVVAGFRWHKEGEGTAVGSLLLGLYHHAGNLQHVGVCASFTMPKRKELVEFLAPYRDNIVSHPWAGEAEADQRQPGGKSRWNAGKDLSWIALRPELVVEVAYEHMQGDRFRHMAQFRRWRTDRTPESCTYAQLEVVPPELLSSVFATGR
jgi:ATP-dependent DNA ligase